MTPSPFQTSRLRPLQWLIIGTLIAGSLDLSFALIKAGLADIAPGRVLQAIASGLLGRASFEGGAATAALGALLHYVLMAGIVTAAFVLTRGRRLDMGRVIGWGIAYGALVFTVMNYVVVPLSRAPFRMRTGLLEIAPELAAHLFLVGIPCLWAARAAAAATRRSG